MKNFLIVIVGPTGIGKTSVSIDIASYFNAEIISADSRQFYREMKIGTAAPSESQLTKIKHHFIRFLSVQEYYSASLYERAVMNLLPSIFAKNRIALMTGGSGMYIDAVCNGIDDIPDTDPAIRGKYNKKFNEEGIESLRAALKLVDPVHYSKVDLRNHKRIIRALEIFESTGRPYSEFLKKNKAERNFGIIKIGLKRERGDLYKNINTRVDEMIRNEFFDFLEGKTSREKAIELIKRNSRRYAKRQMTWWSKDTEIKWFRPEHVQDIILYIEEVLKT
jgi:tRNA dimethylallyltransferase